MALKGGEDMSLYYEQTAAKIQRRIVGLMTEVYRRNGLPMARDQTAALVMAGAWLGVTGSKVRKSSNINERKETINEFNQQKKAIEKSLRRIERWMDGGAREQPGIRGIANMS